MEYHQLRPTFATPLSLFVQEVFGSASPRMSIQGWYHADAPPPGADKASLSFLQAASDADDSHDFGEAPEEAEEEEGGLTEGDLVALRAFVNPAYLSDAALQVPACPPAFPSQG
jgi:hypothetical protein